MSPIGSVIPAAGLLFISAVSAAAQPLQVVPVAPRFHVGGGIVLGQAVGEFHDYVDIGFGLLVHGRYDLDPSGVFSLRLDGAFLNYGNETKEVCLGGGAGCRIVLDLTTSNNIVGGNAGIQLTAPAGGVRPYGHGGVGFSYFATESRVKGTGDADDFASSTNFDDATFSWIAGGGILIPVSSGRTPVAIDIGARYIGNGEVNYLTEGGITDNPDGSIDINPIHSAANLVKYYIGVSVGIGGGGE